MGKGKNRKARLGPKAKAPTVVNRTKEKIHVAVPVTDNVMGLGVGVFVSQLDRLTLDPKCPYSFSWQIVHGKKPVEYARNVLVGNFLKNTNASRLWFIDTDMEPPVNALEMLLAEGDIVAPIAFAFNHASDTDSAGLKLCLFKYNLTGNHTFQSAIPEDPTIRLVDLDGAGTAAMVIKRKVLEDRRLWLDGGYTSMAGELRDCSTHEDDKEFAPPIFEQKSKPNGQILRGEDLDFCLRAKALGYSITGDLGVHFGHIKQCNLREVAEFVKDVAHRAQAQIGAKANTGVNHVGQVDGQEWAVPAGSGVRGTHQGQDWAGVDQAGDLRGSETCDAEGGGGGGSPEDNGRGVPGGGKPAVIPFTQQA